jgi:signal transduction histidine kinase
VQDFLPSSTTSGRTLKSYALFWLVVVLISGSFSNWIFHQLYKEIIQDKNYWIGYVNAAVFATVYMSLFHLSFNWGIRRFPPVSVKNGLIHAALGTGSLFITLIAGFVIMPLISILLRHEMLEHMMAVELGIIVLIVLNCALLMSGVFYIDWYVREQYRANEARISSELSALRAQINPHFLFNAMNTIAALVRKDAGKAEDVVLDLADVFRYILQSSKKAMVPLSEEIDLVRMYLNIEKARFGERLVIDIKTDDTAARFLVPSLLLQPLVENAIKHSVARAEGLHTVHILAEGETPNKVHIRISDTGPGFAGNDIQLFLNKGTGLTNVKKLLELSFPGRYSIKIAGGGLDIELHQKPLP